MTSSEEIVLHTPGPWMVLPNHERGQFVILTARGERLDIAETYGWPSTPREANARLIAAAPELLWALQQVLISAGHEDAKDIARRAIAKAEGKQS
jgi:hypothetical protein